LTFEIWSDSVPLDLAVLEAELKKRLAEPYAAWGAKQTDGWDQSTNFIYHAPTWADLKRRLVEAPADLRNYAINRWFNYWSAVGVEAIFCGMPEVAAARDPKDRLVDFHIRGIPFDHKTSVYPKGFLLLLEFARRHPQFLVEWLYRQQSGERRWHAANRLFLVLYDTSPEAVHWKLRAELGLIRLAVHQYLAAFDPARLVHLEVEGQTVLSDVVWVVR
jgi:hypothetical protein